MTPRQFRRRFRTEGDCLRYVIRRKWPEGHRYLSPDVHRVIARLKTWIRGTHSHVSGNHLDRYLAEFSYRFNRRFKHHRTTIFDRLVTACCATQALTYRQLVAFIRRPMFFKAGVAPAVKADVSMVHFGARQVAWSRALSVVSLVESICDYPV